MRKWGLVVTLFYVVAVLVLVVPAAVLAMTDWSQGLAQLPTNVKEAYGYWGTWASVGVMVLGQALLMGLTVDTTQKRLKPRTHIVISSATTALLLAILTFSSIVSLAVARWGDSADTKISLPILAVIFFAPWAAWGIVFYRLCRDTTDAITRAASWLLRGSVLELLIAVPSHVIVRRRHDCSAPIATGFGISTGIAIMLLAFGPSVLLLYKKRIESLKSRSASAV